MYQLFVRCNTLKKKKRKRKKKFPVSFSIWDPIREKFPRNPLIIQLEYSQIIASRFQLSHRKQAQTSSLRQEVETLKARRTFFSLSLSLCLSRRKDFHLTTSSLCKCAIRKLERHARFIDTLLSFNLPTRASRPWFALGLPEKDPNVDVDPSSRASDLRWMAARTTAGEFFGWQRCHPSNFHDIRPRGI